jgi:hypothetical protein
MHARPPLSIGTQLAAFLQKYSFANAKVLAQHILTSVPTIKEILQKELGLKKLSRGWVPYSLSPAQKLFALRRVQRCYEFYTNQKRPILKES